MIGAMQCFQFSARGISVCVDLSVGHIADLIIEHGGRAIRPLHRAPWIGEPGAGLPADITPGLARLSGDFLCAPFSANDVEPGPGHGWPANAPWDIVESAPIEHGWRATLRLTREVMGATITKQLTVRDDHPFLYQEHRIVGGSGELPVAHHPMSVMAGGGSLSFSPKRLAVTPDAALESDPQRGRALLAYPGRTQDLAAFPAVGETTMDLTQYRPQDRREDFVILVEAPHPGPGWSALARTVEEDLVLIMKDPAQLPVTMLWFSNGGRYYAPWNSRHLGVLGIEDGRTAIGHRQSISDNWLKREGVATSFVLKPDGELSFRHVIGAAPLGAGWGPPATIDKKPGQLHLSFAHERAFDLRFDTDFL